MEHKMMIVGDMVFIADPDFHYGRISEITENVIRLGTNDEEVKYLVKDEDLGYLLAACQVLQGFLIDLDNEG